jgi:6-pyruvoyltetrahydropterin/6-carboxytetrahydropterin synthase
MPIGYLTRIVEFTATHRLPGKDFGTAAADHSHRYQCRVSVKGPLRAAMGGGGGGGGVIGLAALDALLEREVVARFDGRHINEDVAEFADGKLLPTGEALAVYIWERIAAGLPPGVTLHAVRVQEGPHLYSEYFGEAGS